MRSTFPLIVLATAAVPALVVAPSMEVARDAAGHVIARVAGTVNPCGITARNDPPSFRVDGFAVEVTQPVVGVACRNPPPTERAYAQSVDLGVLAPGTYAIHWSYPELRATYTVPGD